MSSAGSFTRRRFVVFALICLFLPLGASAQVTVSGNVPFTFTGDTFFASGRPWYDVRGLGAKGDDSTDDSANIQTALNKCQTNGGTIYFPLGTYKVTQKLSISYSNCWLLFELGATIDFQPNNPPLGNDRPFAFGNGPSTTRPITSASIAVGATTFTAGLANVADLVVGDWLTVFVIDPTPSDVIAFDWMQVCGVASTTVTVCQPFQTAFAPSGAQTLNFQRNNANGAVVENVGIRNATIKVNANVSGLGNAIAVQWTRGAWIEDNVIQIVATGTNTAGGLYSYKSSNVHFTENRVTVLGTGTGAMNNEFAESSDLDVIGNIFETESTSTAATYVTLSFGTTRFHFERNTINGGNNATNNAGIFCHAGLNHGTIKSNVIGLLTGANSVNTTGIGCSGTQYVEVEGNTLTGPVASSTRTGIQFIDSNDLSVVIPSKFNIIGGNTVPTAFSVPYNVASAFDLLVRDDGNGNMVTNHGLFFGGGTPSGLVGASFIGHDSTTNTSVYNANNNGASAFTGAWNCTNVTPVTVNANVTTDQNLMSCTIPAGTLNRVARTLDIWLSGRYSTPAASSTAIVVKTKLGSSTLAAWTSTALGGIQATNDQFNLNAKFTVSTAGASSVFQPHGYLVIDLGAGNIVANSIFADVNTGTVNGPDLTASQTLQVTIAFTVASASNSATNNQLLVQTVN